MDCVNRPEVVKDVRAGMHSGDPKNESSIAMRKKRMIGAVVILSFFCMLTASQALEITTTILPSGTETVPYSAWLEATDGTPPYTWDVAEGFTETSQANSFSNVGAAQGWHEDDNCWTMTIPFEFPFFGETHTNLYINSNGTITFDEEFSSWVPDFDTFKTRQMIAPLWGDLTTEAPGDIYVNLGADSVTVRWGARYVDDGTAVNATAILHSDGRIELKYGAGNANGGLIGISAGDGQNYLLSAKSESGSMDSAEDILFTPVGRLPEGLSCSTDGEVYGTPIVAGTNVASFVVQDSLGASTSKPLEIVIAPNPNMRPVVSSNAPPAGAFSMDEATSQLFRVWAHDPESNDLTYAWTWDGSEVGSNVSSYTQTTAWGDAGLHSLLCYVSDDVWLNDVFVQWDVLVLDDNDGDGMVNVQEIDLGRDPNDPNDAGSPSSLSGMIRGGGVGLTNAYVELRGLGDTVYYQTLTDDSGAYTIDTVYPGHYFIKAGAEYFADEWYNNAIHRTSAVSYAVPTNTSIGSFDFDLATGQNPALVEVTSDPEGAAIYLDYQVTTNVTPSVLNMGEIGNWDWAGRPMAPHVITVKKAECLRPLPQAVAAKEAETVSANFDMTSDEPGSCSIATTPEGAEVYVDYADVTDGISPVVVGNLAPGQHVILLKKPGYLQPRPVVAQVQAGLTNEVVVPITTNTAPNRFMADVRSVPPGATIYVDYLPTTNVTTSVIDWMDPASYAGSEWNSAAHTIMLRKNGFLPMAPRYVSDLTNETQTMIMHLIVDSVTAVDSDGDGMPDQWEDAYRLRELAPTQNGANDDPDHDGLTNKKEMGAGTNPLDGNSQMAVADVDFSAPGPGQEVTFIFDTVPGRMYIVQCSDALTSAWTNLSGIILATDYQTPYTSQAPEGMLHRFYRLIVLTP